LAALLPVSGVTAIDNIPDVSMLEAATAVDHAIEDGVDHGIAWETKAQYGLGHLARRF
jgi:hypothetical protein